MNEQKIDVSTILAVKNLFNSAGWQIYEKTLLLDLVRLNYNIQQLTNGITLLDSVTLESLKQSVWERKILRRQLLLKLEMLDQVDPAWEEQVTNERFGIEKDVEESITRTRPR